MNARYNQKAVTLHKIEPECWKNFEVKNDPRDLSNFESWGMRKIFVAMFGEDNYIWTGGKLQFIDYYPNEVLEMGITHNGILVMKVYQYDTMEQKEQYSVEPEL